MIDIFTPNSQQLARGTAINLAFRFGMQTAKPFEVSEYIGERDNPSLLELKELQGKPFLTTLALIYGGKRFIIQECIITINQEKNIVTTPLQGRDGTIKEYVSDGDFNITVDAGISTYSPDEENYLDYPIEEVEKLMDFLNAKENIGVQSDFLQVFGINSVVVKSYSLQQETHSNRQSINIQMLSDRPYEIKLKEADNYK